MAITRLLRNFLLYALVLRNSTPRPVTAFTPLCQSENRQGCNG